MSQMRQIAQPDELVIWPTVDASVTRMGAATFRLDWSLSAETVQLWLGDRLLAQGVGVDSAEIYLPAPIPIHPQFTLQASDGVRLTVAERFVALAGGVNFRDVGGYRTRGGGRVRWGRVYRSGMLSQLTDADVARLPGLNLAQVVDFRSASEARQNPDRLPDGLYRPLAMESSGNRYWQVARLLWNRNRLRMLLLEGYTDIILRENGAIVGETLRTMAVPGARPMLFHCTAGKDRTGMVTGVLLAALGVDDATILADYSLSNLAFDGYVETLERDIERLGRLGFSAEQVRPLLVADPAILEAALAHIRKRYGSVEDYLTKAAGLTSAEVEQLQRQMVE